ncbi:MAG: alpha/beta hydrolase [Flavipsychrobacter sp.]
MYKIAVTLFLLLSINALAQPEHFNTVDFWSKLKYDTSSINWATTKADTVIVVVSNRKKTNDSIRFMSEYPTNGALHHFIVYSHNGKWHVKPTGSLEEAIDLVPDKEKDWVVYTEGMGKLFTSDLDRGMNMSAQYGVNVIMLDYPSITSTKRTSGNYLFAVKQSKATYKYFTKTLIQIKQLHANNQLGSKFKSLNLFFHSMGNNFAKQLAKKGQLVKLNEGRWVNNIILNAPCVPQSNHRKWLDKITFAQNIYVNYNPDDFVLGAAHVVSKRKQLGEKIKHPISLKAHYINFSKVAEDQHSNFL